MKNNTNRNILRVQINKISPISLFCFLSIVSIVVLFFYFIKSRGELISQYFFYDTRDTGMDFFHSLEYVCGRSPYEKFDTLYPPLANLFFFALYCMIPYGVVIRWEDDFWSSISARGTDIDLRTFQAPLLLFILTIIIAVWVLVVLINSILKDKPSHKSNLVAFCILMSPGILYCFERGNILFLVVPLTMFFIYYRNHSNPIIQELALIALAIAAGLKLSPAFFGVLLLRDKEYKKAIRTILYGISTVIFPMFFFKEGLSGIPLWLSFVFNFSDSYSKPWVGTSFSSILHRIEMYLRTLFNINIGTSWFPYAVFLLTALLLIISLLYKKDWISVLCITMAILMFQAQNEYIYALLFIPLILFLAEESTLSKKNIVPFILMTLLCIHLPLFHTDGNYPNLAVKQLISLLLVVWCLVDSTLKLKYFAKIRK